MTSLDVFSNIGCHALGFKRAGIETVGFCELNPYRRSVIAKHFPGVSVHDDIKSFAGQPANIIIGGPPCQKTSVASAIHGCRTGESLWPYMLTIGVNVEAEWFVVEQPPGNAAWEKEVCNSLSISGYHCSRVEFAACDVGAPYLRKRVFLVACTSLPRLAVAWQAIPSAIEYVKRTANARGDWDTDKLATLRVDAGTTGGLSRRERIEALGDSNPPHMAEVIGRAILHGTSREANSIWH